MEVLMPQLGETVNEGTIAAWHKKVGDAVEKGEVLLDVETDKVATEIEAPASGIMASIDVPEGETVDVGTVLANIAVEGEVIEEKAAAPKVAAAASTAAASTGGMRAKSDNDRVSPAVRRLLKQHNLIITDITGTGNDGRVTRQDVLDHVESGSSASAASADSTRIPFDRVRKLTANHMVRSNPCGPRFRSATKHPDWPPHIHR